MDGVHDQVSSMNFDLFSSKQLPHQCVDSTSTNASLVELDGVAWLRLPGVGWHWLANSFEKYLGSNMNQIKK